MTDKELILKAVDGIFAILDSINVDLYDMGVPNGSMYLIMTGIMQLTDEQAAQAFEMYDKDKKRTKKLREELEEYDPEEI